MNTIFKSLIVILSILCSSCSGQKSKINGVSFVGAPTAIKASSVTPVVAVNANWAAVMPFGFIQNLNAPTVIFNAEKQWWGERLEGVKTTIQFLQAKQIKVMLKPQIWVKQGVFTGNIKMHSEKDWNTLEASYESFILLYAQLANEMEVPIFCIGTELHTFVKQRPEFWKQLIVKVRAIYTGELTYAENWDQYDNVPFWKQLDYIGIDAYFPVATQKTPTIANLKKGWQSHKRSIYKLHKEIQKPVLFTEYGYRSVYYTGKEPWDSSHSTANVDLVAQSNALTTIYEEFWKEPWFAGGFLWKWFHNHNEVGGAQDNRFTVQNKPAENVIRSLYTKNK